jgi:sulfite oxidase
MNRTKPATAKRLELMEEKGIPMIPITQPLEMSLESDEDYLENMRKREGRDPIE